MPNGDSSDNWLIEVAAGRPAVDARMEDGRIWIGGVNGNSADFNLTGDGPYEFLDDLIEMVLGRLKTLPGLHVPIDVALRTVTSRLDPSYTDGSVQGIERLCESLKNASTEGNSASATVYWYRSPVPQTNAMGQRLEERYRGLVEFVNDPPPQRR